MRALKLLLLSIISVTLISVPALYSQDELETVAIKVKGIDLVVELASDPKAREHGLMYREGLPEGRGMLFIYPKEVRCKLWMKNTFFPISAAFIKEGGRITQIVQMEDLNSTKIYKSKERVKYVLEVPLGWFKKHDIKIGDYCIIPEMPSS